MVTTSTSTFVLCLLLPLLSTTSATPNAHHGHPHLARHAAVHNDARSNSAPQPLAIYNNALLDARREAYSAVAERHTELMARAASPNGNGNMVKVRRRKQGKRACKAPTQVVVFPGSSSSSSSAAPTSTIGGGTWATPSSAVVSSSASSITSASASASATSSSSAESSASPSSDAPSSAVSSSAAPATSTSPATDSGRLGMLRPLGRGTADWTTAPEDPSALSFDGALKPLSAGKLPAAGTAPDGSNALVASFPQGTVQLSSGQGFSFYSEGTKNGVYVPAAHEVVFSYSAFFQDGFQFNKGGKMPGLFGGTSFATAKSCSGGKQDGREECFSARLMWRTNGMGEIYNYYPTSVQQGNGYCQTAPLSKCDTTYGDSIGRGAYYWTAGQWTTVSQRLKMNDPGQANGEQELFVNGQSILNLSGLVIATNPDTKIYGIMAQTFFGGSDSTWASPQDQNIWFKDFTLTVIS